MKKQANTIDVKVVNRSGHPLPSYATPQSAGMDVRANLPESPVELLPGQRALIPTGLYMQLPEGYECQVRPRSGLALKHGVTVVNAPGTIDADYRGEVGVILINHGQESYTVADGERIGQLVVQKVPQCRWVSCGSLDESGRGEGGFGHSGKQ